MVLQDEELVDRIKSSRYKYQSLLISTDRSPDPSEIATRRFVELALATELEKSRIWQHEIIRFCRGPDGEFEMSYAVAKVFRQEIWDNNESEEEFVKMERMVIEFLARFLQRRVNFSSLVDTRSNESFESQFTNGRFSIGNGGEGCKCFVTRFSSINFSLDGSNF